MAWSWAKGNAAKDAWAIEESVREQASKRRKLDKKEVGQSSKDEWDDSLELTQADLETLDVIASQAITEDVVDVAPNDRPASISEPTAVDEMLFFAKPSNATFTRRQTSSSSNSSANPASLSSRSLSDTNGSLSSHSSENGKINPAVESVQTLRHKLELEIKRAEEEKYRTAGEMTFLRQSLRKQEEELEKVRAERDAGVDRERQAQKENEKVLQSKLESMSSEAQFRDRELKNLQEQYHMLQLKLKAVEQGKDQPSAPKVVIGSPTRSGSPKKIQVRPSPPSKHKLKLLEEAEQQGKSFPSKSTFLEEVPISPKLDPEKISEKKSQVVTDSKKRKQRLKLRVSRKNGGAEVVQQLISTPASYHHPATPLVNSNNTEPLHSENWDPGLLGLMHAMSTTLRISAGLVFSRKSTALTPLKIKKQLSKKLHKEDSSGTLSVVSRVNFQLAVDGLLRLLDDESLTGDTSTKSSCSLSSPVYNLLSSTSMFLPLLTDYIQHYVDLVNNSVISRSSGSASGFSRSPHQSAISPHTTANHPFPHTSITPASSSLDSSSLDNSMSTSSMLQLFHEGHIYAAGIEAYTLTALKVTSVLLSLSPGLVESIMVDRLVGSHQKEGSNRTGLSSASCGNTSSSVKSDMEADDEKSTSSTEIHIIGLQQSSMSENSIQASGVQTPALYHLLLQLVSQESNENGCAQSVMEQALQVLTLLCAASSSDDHTTKLEYILARGILTNCLRHTTHIGVLVCTVRLLQAVARHTSLSSELCSKSENCPLYLMHRLNTSKDICSREDQKVIYYQEYIICLSSIIAEQQHGIQLLLCNTCPCSEELVPGIVLSLYWLLQVFKQRHKAGNHRVAHKPTPSPPSSSPSDYESGEHDGILWTLGQGVTLLHAVAQADVSFLQHHSPVQLQYVSLLSGVRSALKKVKGATTFGWDFHLSALEELCDFEPDLGDLSQESESEDRGMDQS